MKLFNKIILVLMINFLSLFFVSIVNACDKDEAIDLGGGWCKYYNCGNIHGPGGASIPWPSCGGSPYSCGSGTPNSQGKSGYTYTWRCENWYGGYSAGQPANCSYTPPPPYCSGFGGCGNGNASGHYLGAESNYQQSYNWHCSGEGGELDCDAPIVHGKCNTNINQAGVSFDKPSGTYNPNSSSGMCTSGSFSGGSWSNGTNEGSTYSFSCLGSPGGWGRNDTGCSWTPEPVAGICGGPFNGRIINKNIPDNQQTWSNLCSSGPNSSFTTSDASNDWQCLGTYGGENDACNASVQPAEGKCNDLFNDGSNSVSVLPADGFLCKRGFVKNKTLPNEISNLWTWICSGTGGYQDSGLCSVKKSADPTVDPVVDAKVTAEKLTVTGRITPNIVNKGQYCTLTDLNYEVYPKNSEAFVVCNVHKGKIDGAIVLDADLTKTGHQVSPGYDYYYSCQTLTAPIITASPVVLKCVLNPSIIER